MKLSDEGWEERRGSRSVGEEAVLRPGWMDWSWTHHGCARPSKGKGVDC